MSRKRDERKSSKKTEKRHLLQQDDSIQDAGGRRIRAAFSGGN